MSGPPNKKMTEEERAKLAQKLDDDLDNFIDSLAEKSRSKKDPAALKRPFDLDEFIKELDNHPAFMRDLKPDENGEYSEQLQALQALKYEEYDPDDAADVAESARVEGNKHFKFKKYRWAVSAYTNGIKAKCQDRSLNSVLYANRASAQKHIGNYMSAFKDCVVAQKFNPANTKALLRGIECLTELGYAARTLQFIELCERGLENIRDNQPNVEEFDEAVKKFKANVEPLRTKAAKKQLVEEKENRRRLAERRKLTKEHTALLEAFRERKLLFKPHVDLNDFEAFDVNDICIRAPHTKDVLPEHVYITNGELHWPLMLQYVGAGQVDMIRDCGEESPIADLIAPAFAEKAPWDHNGDNVLFFLPLDVIDDRVLLEVDPKQNLHSLLSTSDYVVFHGLPIIHVYTKSKALQEMDPLGCHRFRLRQ